MLGSGTVVAGISDKQDLAVILCGCLQFVASFIGVGYIWSWVWAVFIGLQKQIV